MAVEKLRAVVRMQVLDGDRATRVNVGQSFGGPPLCFVQQWSWLDSTGENVGSIKSEREGSERYAAVVADQIDLEVPGFLGSSLVPGDDHYLCP